MFLEMNEDDPILKDVYLFKFLTISMLLFIKNERK